VIHSGRVDVRTGVGSYPVFVGHGVARVLPGLVAERAASGRFALISDSNVSPLHGERLAEACRVSGLDPTLLSFPAGEASKTRGRWMTLTDEMLEAGLGRDSCVVAVGGGVTTDLGGFVASTYLRGIPVIQVPTSYLAMVDASVGGKTGVDVAAGKNLVGTFHPPAAVVADTELLRTLPERNRREGLVEAVKHGAVLDEGHFEAIERRCDDLLRADPDTASDVVLASIRIKADVVSKDEFEGGFRHVLNFGHTIGHALEAASEYRLGHGSAVGLGMITEAAIGERVGVTAPGTRDRLKRALDRLIDPAPPGLTLERTVAYLGQDKKVRRGRPRYVLLACVGETSRGVAWTHDVPDEVAHRALREVLDAA